MLQHIIFRSISLTVLGLIVLSIPLRAQTVSAPLALDAKVKRGVLPNGFTYYIRHNETPKGRVVFNLVVKAGSILEDDDQSGLAHFMEHMSFNGTKHFPKNELVDYLQKNGLRFGADINAYTGFDETVYQLPLTNNLEVLEKGLLIIRDWAQEATLDGGEIDKERGVILEEKRTQVGAGQRMQEKYTPMLFNDSRYAKRNPIGTDSSLRNFPPAAIRRFYTDWYRPDLQGIIAVGDFDVAQMEKMIIAKFSALKNPLKERQRINYKIALNGKNGYMALKDREMSATVAQIIIKHQAPEMKSAADYKAAVTARLFNMVVGLRLKPLYAGDSAQVLRATASIGQLMGGLDNFSVNVVAKPGQLQQGVIAVWEAVERIRQFGFSAQELDVVKQIYSNSMKNGLAEKNNISSDNFVQEYIAHFLRGDLAPGIDTEYQLVMGFLADITPADLDRVAKAYIRNDNRNIIVMGPEQGDLPVEDEFTRWLADVRVQAMATKVAVINGKPLLRNQPVAGQVRSVSSKDGITTLIFANGVRAILKPTQFKNDEILFSGFSRGGTSVYGDADYISAKNAASIVTAAGAGNYDHKMMEAYLLGKQMGVQPFISEYSQGVSGGSNSANIGAALELAYAYLTEPILDKSLFNQMISRSKASLMGRDKNPDVVFQDSIRAILSRYNLRRMPVTEQQLGAMNIDRVYEIYKERFADNAGMTFTFVGSFKVDSIRPILEKYLGGLPAAGNPGTFKDPGIGLPAMGVKRVIKKGVGAKANVELFFRGLFDYSLTERIKLEGLKEILAQKLTTRLREQEHGVYSPSVALSLDKIPQRSFTLNIAFECAPENSRKLIDATYDEIRKLQTNGPSAVDMQKFKTESARSRETAVTSNQWWLGYLASQLADGESLTDYTGYLKQLNSLKPATLKAAAGKYLKLGEASEFVLLPE